MSYELRIWDPVRQAPAPASADEALDTMERLTAISDTRKPTLETFGASLVRSRRSARPQSSAAARSI